MSQILLSFAEFTYIPLDLFEFTVFDKCVTDRRTDKQTDGRAKLLIELHLATKNNFVYMTGSVPYIGTKDGQTDGRTDPNTVESRSNGPTSNRNPPITEDIL